VTDRQTDRQTDKPWYVNMDTNRRNRFTVMSPIKTKWHKSLLPDICGYRKCEIVLFANLYFEGDNFQNELDGKDASEEHVQVVESICVMSALTLILQTNRHTDLTTNQHGGWKNIYLFIYVK